MSKDRLSKDTIQAIVTGTHTAPFSILGRGRGPRRAGL